MNDDGDRAHQLWR